MNKRFLTILLFVIIANAIKAQIKTSSWHDGYWGEWKSHTIWEYSNGSRWNEYHLYGGYSGFCIYKEHDHPSDYLFRFQIDSYIIPDKKTIKEHYKNKKWFEYSGTVEYYVTENYPTIAAILKAYEFPYFNSSSGYDGNPCVKRTAKAIIKIAPYKKHPECYNIYFDDVAVAISFDGVHF